MNDFSNEILKSLKNLGENYKQKMCANLDQRFTNEFAEIAEIDNVLKERPENASFFEVSKIFAISESELDFEYKMLKRLPKDDSISHNDFLISLVSCSNMKTMFPNISILAENILLLPIE